MTLGPRGRLVVALVLALGAGVSPAAAVVPSPSTFLSPVPGPVLGPVPGPVSGPVSTYVVTLRPGASLGSVLASVDGQVTARFTHALHGFSVRLPAAEAAGLRLDPRVASVTPDRMVHTTDVQSDPTWGLDRSDQRRLPLDHRFRYPHQRGAGAHVYVVDTGINPAHSELAGRVGASANFVPFLLLAPDPDDWGDCNGHGTHVASTAAGKTWGVAKRATVHAVRVLDCSGSGSISEILEGLDWVAANHQSPAVVNLSLAADGASPELDAAVRGLVQADVSVVVAAGNADVDACTISPASEPAALTVGATSATDTRAPFSNYGPCVDLFAPGVEITGADYLDPTGSAVMSGTSMAAPHVAGAVALLRAAKPGLAAARVQARLRDAATAGVVSDAGAGSPDRLLFVSPGDEPPRARFRVRCRGLSCTLDARRASDDHGIDRYRWKAGRFTRSGRIAHVRFGGTGRKRVELTVVDTRGQRSSAVKWVDVRRR